MKLVVLVICLFLITSSDALAHSGRTDSSGGHNCSSKSVSKGLCSGYHYHSGSSPKPPTPTYSSEDNQQEDDYSWLLWVGGIGLVSWFAYEYGKNKKE